ncbi:MAG: hypothetical protein GF308_00335 [Candidatus Heimdallarchaeota archaeon]|nr:hypothetical protein [Candidatus Heimdallarchaeota archaeon]
MSKKPTFSNHSGKSMEEAIQIENVEHNEEGIAAEFEYLNQKFGKRKEGWFLVKKVLLVDKENERYYDKFTIRLADGKEKDIIFETTNFFGKVPKVEIPEDYQAFVE